jgi:4-methyl-5(b-hydroxyethyl)-thiazole monophosphate biosynthesis
MKGMMLLSNYFEDIEGLGTLDLLRRASIDIDTISISGQIVQTQSKVNIFADKELKDIDLNTYDFLIIPGGRAVLETHLTSNLTKNVLDNFMTRHCLIGLICAAPSIAGKYNYLENKQFTCFPNFEKYAAKAIYKKNCDTVCDDNIITSKACGTTFDFAYHIIKYLKGEEAAKKVLESVYYKMA